MKNEFMPTNPNISKSVRHDLDEVRARTVSALKATGKVAKREHNKGNFEEAVDLILDGLEIKTAINNMLISTGHKIIN